MGLLGAVRGDTSRSLGRDSLLCCGVSSSETDGQGLTLSAHCFWVTSGGLGVPDASRCLERGWELLLEECRDVLRLAGAPAGAVPQGCGGGRNTPVPFANGSVAAVIQLLLVLLALVLQPASRHLQASQLRGSDHTRNTRHTGSISGSVQLWILDVIGAAERYDDQDWAEPQRLTCRARAESHLTYQLLLPASRRPGSLRGDN
jgi:hypothetical protein